MRDAFGAVTYDLADLLYGPVWAASLVTVVYTMREHIGERAPRRMSMALLAALLAAGAMVLVACIRSANRHYHIMHPELHLEDNSTVLMLWTTLVAGVAGAGWHFLGWALVLLGSAAWTSSRLPRLLCLLYLIGGIAALFVYLFPNLEGLAALLGIAWGIWQGIYLWRAGSGKAPAPEKIAESF